MLLLSCFVIVLAVSNGFFANAYIQIAIGQDSTISADAIAATPVWNTTEPSVHPGYKISNVGETAIQASIHWKDSSSLKTDDIFCAASSNCSTNSSANTWYRLPDSVRVNPHKVEIIRPPRNDFYFTRLVIIANDNVDGSNLEATVHVTYEVAKTGSTKHSSSGYKSNVPHFSPSENLKTVLRFGVTKIPFTGSGLGVLINLFWPEKTSVWEELRDKIKNLIDQETFYKINNLLTGRLTGFKRKLEQVDREVKEGQSDVSNHYVDLAFEFIGFEEEFIIRNHHNAKKLNEDLLPVYSNIVLLKAAYYSVGIKCQQKIGLSKQNVDNVKKYFSDMIRSESNGGANEYIDQTLRNQSGEDIPYNQEMYMRNKINELGYLPIWNNLLDHPGQKLVIDEIFYSRFEGVYIKNQDNYSPSGGDPLSSAILSNGKYNEIQKLITYQSSNVCKNCCENTIVGMKVILKNGDTFQYGQISYKYNVVELDGTYRIHQIENQALKLLDGVVYFRAKLLKLDKNEWKNSAEDEYLSGCPQNNLTDKRYFAKENHYIASIYAFFDNPPRHYPNHYPFFHMGVAFLPLKSRLDNTVDEADWKEWTC